MNGNHHIGGYGIGRNGSGNSEIRKLYLAVRRYDNVLRFHIAVNDISVVSGFQTEGNLDGNAGRFLDAEFPFLFDIILQRNSFYQLHNDEVDALIVSHIVHVYNIRMGQTCSRLGLLLKFRNKSLVIPKFRFQHFHRHKTIQLMVPGFVNIRHPAGAHLADDLITFR